VLVQYEDYPTKYYEEDEFLKILQGRVDYRSLCAQEVPKEVESNADSISALDQDSTNAKSLNEQSTLYKQYVDLESITLAMKMN